MRDDYEEPEEAEDGDAETEATVSCPHCGESVEITLDPSGGDVQEYIEPKAGHPVLVFEHVGERVGSIPVMELKDVRTI